MLGLVVGESRYLQGWKKGGGRWREGGGGIGSGVESEDSDKNKESHLIDKFGSRRPGGMIFYFPFF